MTGFLLGQVAIIDSNVIHHAVEESIPPVAFADVLPGASVVGGDVPIIGSKHLPVAIEPHDTLSVDGGDYVLPLIQSPEVIYAQHALVVALTNTPNPPAGGAFVRYEQVVVVGTVPEINYSLPVA